MAGSISHRKVYFVHIMPFGGNTKTLVENLALSFRALNSHPTLYQTDINTIMLIEHTHTNTHSDRHITHKFPLLLS